MSAKNNDKQVGLIEKIFRMFSGGSKETDEEKQTKRLLKGLAELLKKKPKLYDFPNHKVQPTIAKFFHEIYLVVGPVKPFTQNLARSEQIRSIIIETFLQDTDKEFVSDVFTDNILNRFESVDLREFRETMKDKTEHIVACLSDRTMASRINITYAYLCCFAEFCSFDFYSVLKKFDSSLPVANFEYRLNPGQVPANQLLDDFEDFIMEAVPLLSVSDWDQIFNVLKNYRNTEIVNRQAWQKMLLSINEMISSQMFESIVKFIRSEPLRTIKIEIPTVDIVKPYVRRLADRVRTIVQKIEQVERKKVSDKVGRDLFMGADYTTALKFYTKAESDQIFGHGNDGFEFADILSAVTYFGSVFLERDVKKLMDKLILVGSWSNNAHYKDFSNSLEALAQNQAETAEFDKSLTGDTTHAIRLKGMAKTGGRDRAALSNLKTEINMRALGFVRNANQEYTVLARSLKLYIDDFKKKPDSDLIHNWDEVAREFDRPVGRYMADIYTKIYQLLQMMKQYC